MEKLPKRTFLFMFIFCFLIGLIGILASQVHELKVLISILIMIAGLNLGVSIVCLFAYLIERKRSG